MLNDFEIKCKKCNNNIAVDIRATAIQFGNHVRVKFVCLACSYEEEVPVTQNSYSQFEKDLDCKL